MKKKKVGKKRTSGIIRIRRPKVQKVKIEAPEAPVENIVLAESGIKLEPSKEILKEIEKEIPKGEKSKEKKEDKEEKDGKIKLPLSVREEYESKILKIIGITLCIIVMLFWVILAILSISYNSGPKIIEKNVSVTSFTFTTASFAKLENITDVKYNQKIDQLGYLHQEVNDKGITKKYLIDDRGRRIELMLRGISQGAQYDDLFVMDKTSTQLYNVTGIYRYELNKFIIEIDDIVPAEKKMVEISEWRIENMTTDDVKGFTFNIARGVGKIVSFNYTG